MERVSECRRNVPALPWGRVSLVALVCLLATAGTLERFWRSRGFLPCVSDNAALWRLHYDRACHGTKSSVVFLGTSRMQAAISLSEWRRLLPDTTVSQLSIVGDGSPIGILRHLAHDRSDFHGLVVCEVVEPLLHKAAWRAHESYFQHRSTCSERLNSMGVAFLQNFTVLAGSRTTMSAAIKALVTTGELPSSGYSTQDFDRELRFDFSLHPDLPALLKEEVSRLQDRYRDNTFSTSDLIAALREIELLRHDLAGRGGQVVFVRLPSSGTRLALENATFPRKEYWNRISATLGPAALHFEDFVPEGTLVLPDETHLRQTDMPCFTRMLVHELRLRRLISERAPS
jgi:hypothetical protein